MLLWTLHPQTKHEKYKREWQRWQKVCVVSLWCVSRLWLLPWVRLDWEGMGVVSGATMLERARQRRNSRGWWAAAFLRLCQGCFYGCSISVWPQGRNSIRLCGRNPESITKRGKRPPHVIESTWEKVPRVIVLFLLLLGIVLKATAGAHVWW